MKDIYGEKKKPNCKYGMLSCVAMICGSVNATSQLDHENENAFIGIRMEVTLNWA